MASPTVQRRRAHIRAADDEDDMRRCAGGSRKCFSSIDRNLTAQIFYQCLDPNRIAAVDKSDAGYRRVQRAVLDMRRTGLIGWEHVVDGTRTTIFNGTSFAGLEHFLGHLPEPLCARSMGVEASPDRTLV